MKTRNGFVSNSSSSSFIVSLDKLNALDILILKELGDKPLGKYKDYWELTFGDDSVSGYCSMENNLGEEDSFKSMLEKFNVDTSKFRWEHYG